MHAYNIIDIGIHSIIGVFFGIFFHKKTLTTLARVFYLVAGVGFEPTTFRL
jgi:hypothetical protein